jgi:hypothetical protein
MACEVDEQDVEHEGAAAHGLVDGPGARGEAGQQVPHRHHGADVHLLGHVTQAPPGDPVPRGVELADPPERPQEGRDHHDGAVQQGHHGDDRRGGRAEDDEGHRPLVGAVAVRDVQGAEVVPHPDERPDGHQDDAQVEVGLRPERHVRRHQDVALPLHDRDVDHHGAHHHQQEAGPRQTLRVEPAVQQHGADEVEDRDLEEQDPEDQHVEAVQRQDPVVPLGAEQVDRRPTSEAQQDRADPADQSQLRTSDAGWFPVTGISPPTTVVVIAASYSTTRMRPVMT